LEDYRAESITALGERKRGYRWGADRGYFGVFVLIEKWLPKILRVDWFVESLKTDDRVCFGRSFVRGGGEEAGQTVGWNRRECHEIQHVCQPYNLRILSQKHPGRISIFLTWHV